MKLEENRKKVDLDKQLKLRDIEVALFLNLDEFLINFCSDLYFKFRINKKRMS